MAAGTYADWTIILRATNPAYSSGNVVLQCGSKTGALDGQDANDTKYTASSGTMATIASYEAGFSDAPPLYKVDRKAPLADQTKTWDLVVWTTPTWPTDPQGAGNPIRVGVYAVTASTPIAGAKPFTYYVEVVADPTGTYAPGLRWDFTPGSTGTSTAPVFFKDFQKGHMVSCVDAEAAEKGIKLKLVAACPVIPEPGSLLVLATGVTGLFGFAARRRRA